MKLIWVLAFAAGGMSTAVDDDGWVTQTAPVQGEACVLIVCDCNRTQARTGGESGTIEIRYRTNDPREAPLSFVYERDGSLFIIRQENADYSDEGFAIDELRVRMGMGYSMMFPGGGDYDGSEAELYRERCRLTRESAREAVQSRM